MVKREDRSGKEANVKKATKSVGSVRVDTARRTRRGGDRGGVGGVLPAVSLQTEQKKIQHEEFVVGQLAPKPK